MPLEADAADARSPPEGSRAHADGRAKLLQTNNYPSWSQSQEVTSTTSVNNSLQGLIKVPCRKFFLSSLLSLSCCPVSPNGWITIPTPRPWSEDTCVLGTAKSEEEDRDDMDSLQCVTPAPCSGNALRTLATGAETITVYSSPDWGGFSL